MTDEELDRLRVEVALLRERKRLRDAEASGGSSAGSKVASPVGGAIGASDGQWARRPGETDRDFADRVQRQAEGLPEDEPFRPSMSSFELAWRDFEVRQ